MHSLDLILKNMILASPHIYPATWQCYVAIFIDPETEFTFDNACIQAPFNVDNAPVINERYLDIYKGLAITPVGELNYDMKVFMHNFIKENIDMIVKQKCAYTEYLEPSLSDLELLTDQSPVWAIDHSYPDDIVKAAKCVMEKVKYLLWYHFGRHHSSARPIERDAWPEVCYHDAYLKVCARIDFLAKKEVPVYEAH